MNASNFFPSGNRLLYIDATLNKSSDYDIPVTDNRKRIRFTDSATASETFTLPAVNANYQDYYFIIINDSRKYDLYLKPGSSTDTIWKDFNHAGITISPSTSVTVCYDYANTHWDIISQSGNNISVFLTTLYTDFSYMVPFDDDGTVGLIDRNGVHQIINKASVTHFSVVDILSCKFDTTDYLQTKYQSNSRHDFDLFGSLTGNWTLYARVWSIATTGGNQHIVGQFEDTSNAWSLYRENSTGNLKLIMKSGGSDIISISGGTFSYGLYVNIALCVIEGEIGLYINGQQVAYKDSWTTDTFNGDLYIGAYGTGTVGLDGTIADLAVLKGNMFGAAPNSGNTDTIIQPLTTGPKLNLVSGSAL